MEDPVVKITEGKLKGTIRQNYKGEKIYAFLGVPFARPPVGELRFKAPLPPEPWSGIRDATKDGNQCYQRDLTTLLYNGSEDCLFLNIFTKNISENRPLKPVLVFIHGGAFSMGSNNSKMFSPNFLLMEDIVLVSINYRLGILGFLRLTDPSLGVPGNAGLKDQVLALKWLQKNIKNFGGDPNNVTIYGESAGSAAVNYLILSPLSKGLFHKAIMQSGSVLNPWPHIRSNCLDVIQFFKTDCQNEGEILETLMNAPVHDLVEAQYKLSEVLTEDKFRIFMPCVEAPNESAFLTRNPIDIITSGDYNKVPMMIGYNSNEGLMILHWEMSVDSPPTPDIKYEDFIPQQMNLPADDVLRKEICEKLRSVYSNDRSSDRFWIFGDSMLVSGTVGLIENMVKTSPGPIYFHIMSLCSSLNGYRNLYKTQEPGACHGDDLFYLFDCELPIIPKVSIIPGSIEEIAVFRYVRLFGNFLKHGNPTPDQNEFGLTWQPVTDDALYYLDFDEELSLKSNPHEKRMNLWRSIYKLHENTENFMV